jgi:hypothetical protein
MESIYGRQNEKVYHGEIQILEEEVGKTCWLKLKTLQGYLLKYTL